jgi:hypothetical protein
MGIRFYCPNGHKLNVKTFQAGLAGICPFCAAKMQIPLKSTRRSSRSRKGRAQEGTAEVVADESGGIAPPQLPALPATAALNPAAAAAKLADPLVGADEVVWYVRPASGGQFGPAKTNIMRVWLNEGRVGTDTLVWREGWRDWREAGDVFPQLFSRPMVPTFEAFTADPTPLSSPSDSVAPANKASGSRTFAISAAVAIVMTLFLVILVLVLTNK